jgi:hypothetical protein
MINYTKLNTSEASIKRAEFVLNILQSRSGVQNDKPTWKELSFSEKMEIQVLTYQTNPYHYDGVYDSTQETAEDAYIFFDEFEAYDVDNNVCDLTPQDVVDGRITEYVNDRAA